MQLHIEQKRLELKHVWRIARGATDHKEYWFVRLEHEGITGYGEAAHNERYGETPDSIRAFLEQARPLLQEADPLHFLPLKEAIHSLAPGQDAAKAALDLALMDWVGKKLGVPVYTLFGLAPKTCPSSSYSIGIDEAEVLREKVREAQDFPVFKIKLGGDRDEETMRTLREVTQKTVRVDANEGWTDRQLALEKIEWLATLGVEFVEQPMPAGRLDDLAWLRERSPLPLVADEDVKTAADIPALSRAYDGINIKLMKSGGLQEAARMITLARTLGLKIMLGCMVESSLGISAAAQLAPLTDWIDLDGNLLVRNDPFDGARARAGVIMPPPGAGLGATPRF